MKRWLVPIFAILAPVTYATASVGTSSDSNVNIDTQMPALQAAAGNLNPQVLKLALDAYNCAKLSGVSKSQTLTIIDYSLPAAQKRMWVFDLASSKLLFNNVVAHGQGSGSKVSANFFSNQSSTHASSIGLYVTGTTYTGHNGYSLKLKGLDAGFNDKAEARSIVVHGASYVSDQIAKTGQLGRSWGCPAVPQKLAQPIINTIKDRTLVFAYYPDNAWLKQSKYLNCPAATLMANNQTVKANSEA